VARSLVVLLRASVVDSLHNALLLTTLSPLLLVLLQVKILLAGNRDKIAVARSLILDLCKYYYTPITHPGMTHVEMNIDPRYYNYVIGSKGSEIKHIQANYKVGRVPSPVFVSTVCALPASRLSLSVNTQNCALMCVVCLCATYCR
jgi:hypothetical protein